MFLNSHLCNNDNLSSYFLKRVINYLLGEGNKWEKIMFDGGKSRGWERVHRVCPELQTHFVSLCERIFLKMVLPGKIKSRLERGALQWVGY